jgi:uncharacterized protein YjdB
MRTRLTATALGVVCACALACGQKPATIQVSPNRVKIYGLERSQRITARVLDKKGQPLEGNPSINWASSHREIVDVDSGGRLTSKKEGKALVTASLESLSGQVSVEVVDVKAVEIRPLSAHLVGAAGTTLPLASVVTNSHDQPIPIPVSWSSSDEKVATVSPDGVVTSVGAGKTTLLAKVGDLQSAAEVTVDPRPVSKVVLLPATALVRVGDSQHYQVTVIGSDGRAIEGASARYASSDPSVVSVDAAGVASGIKTGVATIRAQVGGATAEATVIVN